VVSSRDILGLPRYPASGPAVATPHEDSSSSGEQSTPLEKGELQTEPECGPATSSVSEEENE